MIYILTGVAKSGKSYIAKKLMQDHLLHLIQTDHIMMALHKGNPHNGLDIKASDSTVSLFLEPYVKELIESFIRTDDHYLLEGVHFLPAFAKSLCDLYPDKIKVLYLIYEHQHALDKKKELLTYQHLIDNPWFNEMNESELLSLCEYLILESKRLGNSCRKFGLPYIEVSNIEKQADDIINKLLCG